MHSIGSRLDPYGFINYSIGSRLGPLSLYGFIKYSVGSRLGQLGPLGLYGLRLGQDFSMKQFMKRSQGCVETLNVFLNFSVFFRIKFPLARAETLSYIAWYLY